MTSRPLRTALLAAALLVAAACGDDVSADDAASTTTAAAPDEATSSTTEDPGTTDTTTDRDDPAGLVEIVVEGGEVSGGGRHEVALGDTVVLRVTSDVADEVHVHGYDHYLDLSAGQTAELEFEATLPGVWEVELHDSGIVLAELQVQ